MRSPPLRPAPSKPLDQVPGRARRIRQRPEDEIVRAPSADKHVGAGVADQVVVAVAAVKLVIAAQSVNFVISLQPIECLVKKIVEPAAVARNFVVGICTRDYAGFLVREEPVSEQKIRPWVRLEEHVDILEIHLHVMCSKWDKVIFERGHVVFGIMIRSPGLWKLAN